LKLLYRLAVDYKHYFSILLSLLV